MLSLISMLILVIVVPPFVSSKSKHKLKRIHIIMIIFAGIALTVIVNLQYISLLDSWNYNYKFTDNNISYQINFPRKPQKIEKEDRIDFSYHDDYRSIELNHIKNKVEIDIDKVIKTFTEKNKVALVTNEQGDDTYFLRFNRMDDQGRFIIIYKKIYLLDKSYLELTYSYLKKNENVIKNIERYLDLEILN